MSQNVQLSFNSADFERVRSALDLLDYERGCRSESSEDVQKLVRLLDFYERRRPGENERILINMDEPSAWDLYQFVLEAYEPFVDFVEIDGFLRRFAEQLNSGS